MSNPAFAVRLKDACDSHMECPAFHQGRLTWIRKKLAERGIALSLESLSRWYSGESRPRQDKCEILADILGVESSWLYMGTQWVQKDAAPREIANIEDSEERKGPILSVEIRENKVVKVFGIPLDLTVSEAQKLANIILAHVVS